MRPPFPGMDPWLEHPARWLGVHNRLITAVADDLVPKVAPRYYVDVQQHMYLTLLDGDLFSSRPEIVDTRTKFQEPVLESVEPDTSTAVGAIELDVQVPIKDRVEEWYLEVREVGSGTLVTVIEILSPTNKSHRTGRRKYGRKRNRILSTDTSLVEIDLLRAGKPMPVMIPQAIASDYRILVSRGRSRPKAKLYAFGVRQPIPSIPIPLLSGDPEPWLDLNAVFHGLYERARFDLRLDYARPPVHPLSQDDGAWAHEIVSASLS